MKFLSIAIGIVMALGTVSPIQASNNYDSDKNQPSYWGNQCVKYEISGEKLTYSADSDATRVIIKGGTTNKVYDEAPFTNLYADVNHNSGKPYAISHVIVCTDEEEEKPELCEYNEAILASDDNCKPENPPTDDPEDNNDPEDEDGEVLSTTTDQPSILPVTGPGMVIMQTMLLGAVTYLAQKAMLATKR